MPTAAVPNYIPAKLLEAASPGLRFGMYLPLWGIDQRSKELLWSTADVEYKVTGQERSERPMTVENKRSAVDFACKLNNSDRDVMRALARRQRAAAEPTIKTGSMMAFEAIATAPFTTGLGNEHPLENGFAFLNPYGLPYLPGSGVKGAVRQAARELMSGEWGESGWSAQEEYQIKIGEVTIPLTLSDVLFGRESDEGEREHVRGALSFWDVVPVIEGVDRLAVEVMTPHQTHYYQKAETLHDSGSPIPIYFLTVPLKSKFSFHVFCDRTHLNRLAPSLAEGERWKPLIEAAFAHAFQWLGFGAKTSVGYGAFAREQAQPPAEKPARSPAVNEIIWKNVSFSWNAGGGGKLQILSERKTAESIGPEAQRLFASLPPELVTRIKDRKSGQRADVKVQIEGNMIRVIEIIPLGTNGS